MKIRNGSDCLGTEEGLSIQGFGAKERQESLPSSMGRKGCLEVVATLQALKAKG